MGYYIVVFFIKKYDILFVKKLLIKYKNHFQDFDSVTFIPLLENRIEKIKNNEFEDNYYETQSFAMLKQVEEIKKQLNRDHLFK